MTNARITLTTILCTFALMIERIIQGETLPDPTRPAFGTSTSSASAEETATSTTLLELQSVFIAPGMRWAIINGHTLVIGESIGEAQLVDIEFDTVTLARGDLRETLKLFPNVETR